MLENGCNSAWRLGGGFVLHCGSAYALWLNDMADAKALLESIARSFGYIYGRERGVRINTISQSPTETTAGGGVMGSMPCGFFQIACLRR
jgi:enoyl-[acyl-carrier-protein] reductase (NADH)